jgi:hypothetical protein
MKLAYEIISPSKSSRPESFVELLAVVRELVGAAHFAAARIFLVGDQAVAVPVCRDLLIIDVLGFFRFAAVGKESDFAILIVGEINFGTLLRDGHRIRRGEQFLHALAVLLVLAALPVTPVTAVRSATHAGNPSAHMHSAAVAARVGAPLVLHFFARVIAFLPIEFPTAENGCSRLYLRWSIWRLGGWRR